MENPTLKRMKRVNLISNLIVIIINLFICIVCYLTLGKSNLNQILYKKAFELCGESSFWWVIWICVMFMFSIVLFLLPLFNPSIWQIILDTFFKKETGKYFGIFSIAPAVIIFSVSILYPFIENIIDFFSVSILLFNGVITPVFLKAKMLKL